MYFFLNAKGNEKQQSSYNPFYLEIQNIKFDALITALKSDSIDLIISSMTATEERRKSINFSDFYLKFLG